MAAGNEGGIHRKGFGWSSRLTGLRRRGVLPTAPLPDLLTPLDSSYSARGGRRHQVGNWVVARRSTFTYTVPRVRTLVEEGGPVPIAEADTYSGIDSQSLTVAILQIDTYSGNDLQTLAVALVSADLAGGADAGAATGGDMARTDLDISYSSETVLARQLSSTDQAAAVEAEEILYVVRFLTGDDAARGYESAWIRKVGELTALGAFTGGHSFMGRPQDWESNLVNRMRRRRGV